MTDAEIKQNLKFIAKYCKNEYNEIRVDELLLNALDLINRQQAEVEKLKDSRDRWKRNALSFDEASRETEKELEKLYAEIERLNGEVATCKRIGDKKTEAVIQHDNFIRDLHKEIERLQKENNQFGKMYSEIKAEAIKEFAERLKADKFEHRNFGELVYVEDIDNLVKEMVGDAE